MTRPATRLAIVLCLGLLAVTAAGLVGAQEDLDHGDERAELTVIEEEWASSEQVRVDRQPNRTIYHASGPRYEVQLDNVDHDNVTSFRLADGEAQLNYDERRDVYLVEPAGEGTITLKWHVTEGNSSNRYVASIRASNVDWTHLQEEEHQNLQQQAENWSAAVGAAREVDPNRPAQAVISDGLTYATFFASPFSSFSQDMKAVVIMMTLRPGGLAILGFFIFISVGLSAGYFRYRNRTEQQLAEWDDIQVERDQAWLEKARRIIQQHDHPDLFPDHIAQAMYRLFGSNTWKAFKNVHLMLSPTHVKGLIFDMMGQVGYVAAVERDEHGDVVEARAVHRSNLNEDDPESRPSPGSDGIALMDLQTAAAPELPESDLATDGGTGIQIKSLQTLRYDDAADREIIDAIPGEDLDLRVFDDSVQIDADRIDLPIDNHDIEDAQLIDELQPDFPHDFEDEEQMAESLGELMEFVTNHSLYTDEEGNVREEMDLLSFLAEMNSVMADKADFPTADVYRRLLFWNAEQLDADRELNAELADLQSEGIGRSSSDEESVISDSDVDFGFEPGGEGA